MPAVFRIWYEAPDGKSRWLGGKGEWLKENAAVYQGNLFYLEPALVFQGDTSELEPGEYVFYFSVEPVLEQADSASVFTAEIRVAVKTQE